MPRVCELTGRRTVAGRTYTIRGKAKYLGGVGTKITGKTKRQFKANIHTFNVIDEDGRQKRVRVSAKAVKLGLITKPLKRKYARRLEAVKS